MEEESWILNNQQDDDDDDDEEKFVSFPRVIPVFVRTKSEEEKIEQERTRDLLSGLGIDPHLVNIAMDAVIDEKDGAEFREMIGRLPDSKGNVEKLLNLLWNERVERNADAIDELVGEIEALKYIFPGEMSIVQSIKYPLALKFELKQENAPFNLVLIFKIREGYPISQILQISCFIPPPFNHRAGLENVYNLEKDLNDRSKSLLGQPAIYEIIEIARSWIDSHMRDLLKSSENSKSSKKFQFEKIFAKGVNRTVDRGEIEELILKAIAEVKVSIQNKLNISISTAWAKKILRKTNWNIEEAFLEAASMVKILTSSNFDHGSSRSFDNISSLFKPASRFHCLVCFDSFDINYGVELNPCCHSLCVNCWNQMINIAINQGRFDICCPGRDNDGKPCNSLLDDDFLCANTSSENFNKIHTWVQNSFIRSRFSSLKWCINSECFLLNLLLHDQSELLAHENQGSLVSICSCKAIFCPFCNLNGGHWPWTCEQNSSASIKKNLIANNSKSGKLIKAAIEMLESKVYIDVFGKECPNCKTRWEKNGGCLHMNCGNCSYHWCWACQGPWQGHTNFFACIQKETEDKREIIENKVIEKLEVVSGVPEHHKKFTSFLRQAEKHHLILNEISENIKKNSNVVESAKLGLSPKMVMNLAGFQIKMHSTLGDILIFIDLIQNEEFANFERDEELSSFMIIYSYLEMITSQLDQVLKINFPLMSLIPSNLSQIKQISSPVHVEGLMKHASSMLQRAVNSRNEISHTLYKKVQAKRK